MCIFNSRDFPHQKVRQNQVLAFFPHNCEITFTTCEKKMKFITTCGKKETKMI